MRNCIICRKQKKETEFNDEHVIPQAIGGYYHIYTVCIGCNSNLGNKIDVKLTTHSLINFIRYELKMSGYSGRLPNPLIGDYEIPGQDRQRVRLELDPMDRLIPKVVRNIKQIDGYGSFKLIIDQSEVADKDTIIAKFLSRRGTSTEQIQSIQFENVSAKPTLHGQLKVDTNGFKIALLKIAYEFTVSEMPDYFDDPQAKRIAKILETADYNAVDTDVEFLNNGIDKDVFSFLDRYVNFKNNNHYIILLNFEEYGLVCLVNIFDLFYIAVRMSTLSYDNEIIIGKNDIENHRFDIYNINSIVKESWNQGPTHLQFQCKFISDTDHQQFLQRQSTPKFALADNNGETSLFYSDGRIAYPRASMMLDGSNITPDISYDLDKVILKYQLDEELFVKELPTEQLHRVLAVIEEKPPIKPI
ncbi:HNH endonuclease [Fibrella sp. HMF5335]|uniref:HNH endonuclease n=1 Tax=Fibrella rubiginis TaxID=2817060 RepID=A0A939K2L6_9BACT|nr:HNH endonuclease [Fibrella rubiginis]MBO0936444.1 HNH endonuclease [Fibrella rubiginis]